MAKSIKAIECPKCGSTQKTAVRPDTFRYESCGTEYYLDNDDINVNYTVRQPAPTSPAPGLTGTRRAVVVGAVAVGASDGLVERATMRWAAAGSYLVSCAWIAPGGRRPAPLRTRSS